MITSDAFGYIDVLGKAADASWQRETIIANNMANADTPGYKRKDIEFEGVLRKALLSSKERTLEQAVRHMDTSDLEGIVYTDYENYSYRIDGNNVDMDTENVELASEAIRYQALTSSITNEFDRFSMVAKRPQ
ncbi:MAG: flagellar basal body rod protein FlgB [Pseudobutyrivibrio sp.]|nr:flagellar basal body rod protein FlgB [Pseudobutyrivibrio sp.]